ncbi:PREDICTED: potassium transporter 7-like [Fragaria vesca subsp. vesca]
MVMEVINLEEKILVVFLLLKIFLALVVMKMIVRRENIGGVFVAEDISSTGSDESDRSGRENIGGVCFVAEDCSSTGSSIGIQYVDQVSVDQVPPDIASFEAVIRNSVCSVVGGLKVEVHAINQNQVMMISAAFLIILCSVQNFGTSKVGIAIDPAFFIWFCPLRGIGIYNIVFQNDSSVLRAFNHVHIYSFFKRNSTKALHSLESCLLCATGSEAMHTDTFVCLVLSSLMWGYLGHTAYLMENPSGADQHLFPSISSGIYANNLVDIAPMGVSSSCAAL